jgi:hypothetical protein
MTEADTLAISNDGQNATAKNDGIGLLRKKCGYMQLPLSIAENVGGDQQLLESRL